MIGDGWRNSTQGGDVHRSTRSLGFHTWLGRWDRILHKLARRFIHLYTSIWLPTSENDEEEEEDDDDVHHSARQTSPYLWHSQLCFFPTSILPHRQDSKPSKSTTPQCLENLPVVFHRDPSLVRSCSPCTPSRLLISLSNTISTITHMPMTLNFMTATLLTR